MHCSKKREKVLPTGRRTDTTKADGAMETNSGVQTDTLKQYRVVCQTHTKNSRRVRERHVAELAKLLRRLPTIPADAHDSSIPCRAGLRVDAAVELPAAHCAFRGCAA